MFRASRFFAVGLLVWAYSISPAAAQSEAALRSAFEGRRVRLKIAMPGTSDGVDVPVGRAFDYKQLGDRLKRYGTAIESGDRALVTLVKLKGNVVEFQLDGGGYGTLGDDTSTSSNIPRVEKSNREKDLETAVKNEADATRKRSLQRELDDVRRDRERENRRIDAERALAEEAKTRELARRRLAGGSRFNVRYPTAAVVTPEQVRTALAELVDFAPDERPQSGGAPGIPPVPSGLRKGMLRADAQREFGAPIETSERREGTLTVRTLVFSRGDERITAEFVEDVLIRYTIVVR